MITLGNKTRKRDKPNDGVRRCPHCNKIVPDSKACINCGHILDARLRKLGEVNDAE